MSRWNGLGGHCIDVGIPYYVTIDRKPENSCEIQNAARGRSGIILRIQLVNTAEDDRRWPAVRYCGTSSPGVPVGWFDVRGRG